MKNHDQSVKSETKFGPKNIAAVVGSTIIATALTAPVLLDEMPTSETEAKIRVGIAMGALLFAGLQLDKKARIIIPRD